MIRHLLATAMCLATLAAQTRPGEKRFSLRGEIVDGLTGRPIADAELGLDTAEWQPASEPITPDRQGRFVFRGLAAGLYILRAFRPDVGTVFFGELPEPGAMQGIRIGPDDEEKFVRFRLTPRSIVTGIVRDESGDPVLRADVTVSRSVWRDGRVALEQFNQAMTDDRGRYRISNLQPGGYIICAHMPSGNAPAPAAGPVDFASRSEPRFYARSCYGGPRPATVRVAPGRRIDVDLTLGTTSAVWVRGHLLNVTPNPVPTIQLIREDPFDAGRATQFANLDISKGTFAFWGVAPGRYWLQADVDPQNTDTQQKRLTGRLLIDVGNSDLHDLDLPLVPAGEMDVVLHGPEGKKIEPGAVTISLRSTASGRPGSGWAEAQPNGPFRFRGLSPGSYWLVSRTKDPFCVLAVRLGDEDVLHRVVTITPAATTRLDVTVSDRCGVIKGRAVSREKPVPDAKMLLLLSGSASDPGDLFSDYADDRGEFLITGLAPGRYQLWAWHVDEFGSFAGPASLAGEEARATTVVLRDAETATVDVELLKPEGQRK